MSRYQKMYDRIRDYWESCAREVFCLPESKVASFVERHTRSSYEYACKSISKGRATEEEIIAEFPLDFRYKYGEVL